MDDILKDKIYFEYLIKKYESGYLNIAQMIGKKFSIKYNPENKKKDEFLNPPYMRQLWLISAGARDVLLGRNMQNFVRLIRPYHDPTKWDRIENALNLGTLNERTREKKEFDKKRLMSEKN